MTDRIKLTEDMFDQSIEGTCNVETFPSVEVVKQILEDQEKAEKWGNPQTLIMRVVTKEQKQELEKILKNMPIGDIKIRLDSNSQILEQENKQLKQKLERVETLRLWIERDINAAKINKDNMAENMATCYNSKLKAILKEDSEN